jgi:hypothetical protein
MNLSLKKGSVVALVTIASMFLNSVVGCSKRDGGTGLIGSPYSANYKIATGRQSAILEVTVRGPAAKLAVILTDPQGQSDPTILEKVEMISNSHTVQMSMAHPKVGKYVLQVKTVDPEEVVWQKDIVFTLDKLVIEDISFHLGGPYKEAFYELESIDLTVRKVGNLPVIFTGMSIQVGGVTGRTDSLNTMENGIMMTETKTFNLPTRIMANEKMEAELRRRGRGGLPTIDYAMFWPGDRYLVKGKLMYDDDMRSLDFEKELVVSSQSGKRTTTDTGRVVPALTGRVVDQAGFLGNDDEARVESAILELERATGGQMAILTVPTLGGDKLKSFSMRVEESWKIGHKGQDNGALLVLVRDSHEIQLLIGRGWEGAVSDVRAGDIVRDVVTFFRAGHFSDGLVNAVRQVQKYVTMNGEPRTGADR